MLISDILCNYKEYRLVDNDWELHIESQYKVDSQFIDNMVESSRFSENGGVHFYYKQNRRFGLVARKAVIISTCEKTKYIYFFTYNNAFSISNELSIS